MATSQQIHKIMSAVESGSISAVSFAELSDYISLLTHSTAPGEMSAAKYIQVCEAVRLHMLRAMIEAFEARSKVMQTWMLFFAILAVAAPFVQPLIMAQSTSSPTSSTTPAASASASPAQPQVTSSPNPAQRPSSGPAKATQASSSPTSANLK